MDVDSSPLNPTLSIDDVTVGEGDSGTTPATFTVALDPVEPAQTVTVDYDASHDRLTFTAKGGEGA